MVCRGVAVSISQTPGQKISTAAKPGGCKIKRNSNKRTVVLIEPDNSVRDALSVLLEGEGWQVYCLDGCVELANLVQDQPVIAVISESTLPGCAAEEVLEVCSKYNLPVVFTGHDLPLQGAVDLIRQGATDFLDKPFPQSRLLDLLDGLKNQDNAIPID